MPSESQTTGAVSRRQQQVIFVAAVFVVVAAAGGARAGGGGVVCWSLTHREGAGRKKPTARKRSRNGEFLPHTAHLVAPFHQTNNWNAPEF